MSKGISNDVQATSRKKFVLNPDVNGGIPQGALVDVEVTLADIANDSKMTSFRGHKIPRLVFHFESANDGVGVKTAYYDHAFLPVEHNPENVMNVKANGWKFDSIATYVKHLHEVLTERNLTPEEAKLMTFNLVEKENDLFKDQPVEEVIKAWTGFFNGIVSVFKGGYKVKDTTAPCIYTDVNGVKLPLWIKLLLYVNGQPVNNGDPGFPLFVGEGIFQKIKTGVARELRIKVEKGESIKPIPKASKVIPGSNIPGAGVGTPVRAEDVPDFMKNNDIPY